jgi:hypothetical protein
MQTLLLFYYYFVNILGVCRNETQAAGYGVGSQATPQPCFAAQSENQRKEAAILPRMSQFA